jgi:glycosyltransferase involved in cell wall biosynthesis
MDVFLLTSSWEGLPMAVIEAMASGLPIIATDVGGLRELVFDGRNGKLCSVGDVKSLAAACIQLIQNPRLRERQGNESRMIASEQFSEQRMLKEYGDIYKRCGDGGKMQKP